MIWCFGDFAGLDFNSGAPVPFVGSKLSTHEGSASVADRHTGGLLFYTDGMTVWNRNHRVMPNGAGLKGYFSTTQSALIVPAPGDTTKYYIFTAAPREDQYTNGIQYSVVDMTKDGGLGDIVIKNVLLLAPATERLCAVTHCNGRDYWMITHGWNNDVFFAYQITRRGIAPPIISRAGSYEGEPDWLSGVGYLKASPDGKMLARAIYGQKSVEVCQFDNSTGYVSLAITIPLDPGPLNSPYGVSFSPNSTKLYVTEMALYQYDVTDYSYTEISASKKLIAPTNLLGAIQIAPDGKLYIANSTTGYLDAIDSPDSAGAKSLFRTGAVTFPVGASESGLPNMIDADSGRIESYIVGDVTICHGENAQLWATGGATYAWFPTTSLSCPTCANPIATPDSTTSYTVRIMNPGRCPIIDTVRVTVRNRVRLNVGATAPFCRGDSLQLVATGSTNYRWSPAIGLSCATCPNPLAFPSVPTTYKVVGTNAEGCRDSATVTVQPVDRPVAEAGASSVICKGDGVQLGAQPNGFSYKWSPAEGLSCTTCQRPLATPEKTTVYYLTVSNSVGCATTDSVQITVIDTARPANAGPDVTICAGERVQLHGSGGISYFWSPVDELSCVNCPDPVASPLKTTTYRLLTRNPSRCPGIDSSADSITIFVRPPAKVTLSPAPTICDGDSATLSASGGISYRWEPADGLSCTDCPTPMAAPPATTLYTVSITDSNGCRASDTVRVTVRPQSMADAGPDGTICLGGATPLNGSDGAAWNWDPATGLSCTDCRNPIAAPAVTTTYHLTVTNSNGCRATDSVTVFVSASKAVDAGPDVTVCPGGSVRLTATGGTIFRWSPATGLSCTDCPDPVATPAISTTYHVQAIGPGDCPFTDSVTVTVFDAAAVDAGPDATICSGGSDTLRASDGNAWQWSPSAGLSCADCRTPIATPDSTTTYRVTILGGNGCTASDSVTVNIVRQLMVDAGPDMAICPGDSAILHATGGASYHWSPSIGLSCADCADPVARPDSTTIYTVMTSSGTCSSIDSIVVTVTDGKPLHARIARDLHVRPGESLTVPVTVDNASAVRAGDTVVFDLGYAKNMFRVDTLLTGGTILDGWRREMIADSLGRLAIRFIAPPGGKNQGDLPLLQLEIHAYVSDSVGGELPFNLDIGSRPCMLVTTETGRLTLDSICGLHLRLIEQIVGEYALRRNAPNPFNPATTIEFSLGLDGPTRLEVLNGEGARVALLVDGYMGPGRYSVMWDAASMPSGIYFYRLVSGDWSRTGRMMLVR
ncbi:MAG: hypothetical protein JWQ98_2358 [Chlorobi bacterium]|nr:hypothetical protein [Chlorobiota bacterium]